MSEGSADSSNCSASILAVAYSNLDGSAGYDPSADVLISELVDSNGDQIASAGDTVFTRQYPLDFVGSAFGSFQVTQHTVASFVGTVNATAIYVAKADGDQLDWYDNSQVEIYSEVHNGLTALWIGDRITGTPDQIALNSSSLDAPSRPDTIVQASEASASDDDFIDVDILI